MLIVIWPTLCCALSCQSCDRSVYIRTVFMAFQFQLHMWHVCVLALWRLFDYLYVAERKPPGAHKDFFGAAENESIKKTLDSLLILKGHIKLQSYT